MSGVSPNRVPSPRFSNGTPSRNQHRQPLYLPPNSPFMSPRSHRMLSPGNRPSGGSPDFIPLGVSSPVNRTRHSWNRGNHSNSSSYSSYSTSSTPSSFNSSYGYTPYKRHGSRGNFHRRGGFNHSSSSGPGSPPIHLYYDKEALEDPWAELTKKLGHRGSTGMVYQENKGSSEGVHVAKSEERTQEESSGSDIPDDDSDAEET